MYVRKFIPTASKQTFQYALQWTLSSHCLLAFSKAWIPKPKLPLSKEVNDSINTVTASNKLNKACFILHSILSHSIPDHPYPIPYCSHSILLSFHTIPLYSRSPLSRSILISFMSIHPFLTACIHFYSTLLVPIILSRSLLYCPNLLSRSLL